MNLWNRLVDWIFRLADQQPLAYQVLLGAALVVLLLLLAHIGYVLWRILRPAAGRPGAGAAGAVSVLLDAAAHRARADELARAGRFAEALGHRFLALVLELERAGLVRFHVSKTPAEYVAEARLDEAGRTTFAGLVGRLYRHLFGAVPCGEAEYQAFGADARSLEGHVVPA